MEDWLDKFLAEQLASSPEFGAYLSAYERLGELGKQFKAAREKAGLSIAEVTKRSEMDEERIRDWETVGAVDLDFVEVFVLVWLVGLDLEVALKPGAPYLRRFSR